MGRMVGSGLVGPHAWASYLGCLGIDLYVRDLTPGTTEAAIRVLLGAMTAGQITKKGWVGG